MNLDMFVWMRQWGCQITFWLDNQIMSMSMAKCIEFRVNLEPGFSQIGFGQYGLLWGWVCDSDMLEALVADQKSLRIMITLVAAGIKCTLLLKWLVWSCHSQFYGGIGFMEEWIWIRTTIPGWSPKNEIGILNIGSSSAFLFSIPDDHSSGASST